ncbi:HEPN family nuclease [Cronobacter dublinensis]
MGNYSDFETDFVQRTLALIDQYNEMIEVQGKPFREQYNYTLTLNCLLGLIVLPKERALSFLPADRLTQQLKTSMGLRESQLPGPEMTLRTLILKMRNSVAHFSVQVVSVSDERLVDLIAFRDDPEDENAYAIFSAPELLPFLKYYSALLLDNIFRRRAQGVAAGDL